MSLAPTEGQKFQIFQDSNKFSAEYARHAISYAFYLNGAAATAILAAGKTEFYPAAIILGVGAAIAVLCIGVSYVYILLIGETWRQTGTEKNGVVGVYFPIWNSDIFIPLRTVWKLRFIPVALWIISVVFFIKGAVVAWSQF